MATIEINADQTSASIYIGKDGDLSDSILCKSPNGKYFLMHGTYFKDSGSETESLALFTENDLIYRKKYEHYIEEAILFDDGTSVFYTEDTDLVSFDSSGKQNFKKHVGIYLDDNAYGINNDRAFFFGDDDDGKITLFIYVYSTKKAVKRIISDIEQKDDEGEDLSLSADDAIFYRAEKGFIILYSDKETALMFDFDGTPITPDEKSINDAIAYMNKRETEEKAERERKRAENEEFWKKREALAETLFTKFGKNKKAAIKFMVESEKMIPDIAETTVENIYTKYESKLNSIITRQKEEKIKSKIETEQKIKQKEEYRKANPSMPFAVFKIITGTIIALMSLLIMLVELWGVIGAIIGIAFLISGIRDVKKIKRNQSNTSNPF